MDRRQRRCRHQFFPGLGSLSGCRHSRLLSAETGGDRVPADILFGPPLSLDRRYVHGETSRCRLDARRRNHRATKRRRAASALPPRRSLLGQFAVAGAAGPFATPSFAGLLRAGFVDDPSAPLRAIAAQRGIAYGAAVGSYQRRAPEFAATRAREAGILVAEYEMKRGVIEEVRGRYDFSGIDTL